MKRSTLVEEVKKTKEDDFLFEKAGEIIREGGLVAFPTETVYGLGADACNEEACRNIYKAKMRPQDNPLIVHIASLDDIDKLADLSKLSKEGRENVDKLTKTFFPGPLTLILPKKDIVGKLVTGGLDTVAFRMPVHETARKLIKESGTFIAAPSANLSGKPSPTRAAHVIEDLSGRVDMIIKDDSVDIGIESTILDCSTEKTILLRPGFITIEEIEALIGEIEISSAVSGQMLKEGVAPKAPGMKYRHYAPKAPLTLIKGEEIKIVEKVLKLVDNAKHNNKKCGLLLTDKLYKEVMQKLSFENEETVSEETFHFSKKEDVIIVNLGKDKKEQASSLFAALRKMDTEEIDLIYSQALDNSKVGLAIMNRLIKAADNNIMTL